MVSIRLAWIAVLAASAASDRHCTTSGDDAASALQVPHPLGGASNRPCPKTADSLYAVALLFAGRRDRMTLNLAYLDRLLATCALDEVHVWIHSQNHEDVPWLRSLADRQGYTVFQFRNHNLKNWKFFRESYRYYGEGVNGKGADITVEYVQREGEPTRFRPAWSGANQNNTVIVKVDDDIVYIDTRRFPAFVDYVRRTPEMFLVHGNVVNNGVAAYYQTQQDEDLKRRVPELATYPHHFWTHHRPEAPSLEKASGKEELVEWGRDGNLWNNGSLATRLHEYFLEDPSRFVHEVGPQGEECIVFKGPGQKFGQGRFSLNFFGARWAVYERLSHLLSREDYGWPISDEFLFTTQATTEPSTKECMLPQMVVAHYAFHVQSDVDVLPLYTALAEKEASATAGRLETTL